MATWFDDEFASRREVTGEDVAPTQDGVDGAVDGADVPMGDAEVLAILGGWCEGDEDVPAADTRVVLLAGGGTPYVFPTCFSLFFCLGS